MDWLIIVIVVTSTALAMVIVFRIQQTRLQHSFRLEIVNQGNARSRYQLRAEDSPGLQFRFMLGGDDLPKEALAEPGAIAVAGVAARDSSPLPPAAADEGPRQKGRSAGQRIDQASRLASLGADVLLTLGSLLPQSIGGPLLRRAGQLQMGRVRMAQATRVSNQVVGLGSSGRPTGHGSSSSPARAAGRAGDRTPTRSGPAYSETPYVRPGETLAIDLVVKTTFADRPRQASFRILSRSVEQEEAPFVVENGLVRIGGGIWGHRYLPYLAVLATGVVGLILALWLSANGAPF